MRRQEPERASVSAVLLMSASAHLITAQTKGQEGISLCDIPQHAPQAQLKAKEHNSPPSLSVFFTISPSFFPLFYSLDCSVFLLPLQIFLNLSLSWEIQAACCYCICHILYLGHICISLHLVNWVREEYL